MDVFAAGKKWGRIHFLDFAKRRKGCKWEILS